MTINATPLTPALGAKVEGIDLTRLTAEDPRTVYSL